MPLMDPFLDKFSESGRRVLQSALEETRRRSHYCVTPEYLLLAVINEEPELFEASAREASIKAFDVLPALEKRLEKTNQHTGKGFHIKPETIEVLKRSMDKARSENRRVIEANDICAVLTEKSLDWLNAVLENSGN